MPAIGYPYNFLQGLSDFWTRFFVDADQLDALYRGSAILVGQAYLDLMSATLGIALKDAVALDTEYYQLLAMREDEVRFVKGATAADDRWAFTLPDPVVSFASIDNRVIEPTASLEPAADYDLVDRIVYFKVDPTDTTGTGIPLNGYARRGLDVSVGGQFTDSAVTNWITLGTVKKGDTLRILDIGTDGSQRKRSDHTINLVRPTALYVATSVPLPAPSTNVTYIVIRKPPNPSVTAEIFTLDPPDLSSPYPHKKLAHERLDYGSVRVYAKNTIGADVVEGVDYTVNYENGTIYALPTWLNPLATSFAIDYTWRQEVYPLTGSPWHNSATGTVVSSTTTTRVVQIAAWAPDARVDRRTLANNFGVLIGRTKESSESYRRFLEGIFQLYIMGPTLQRLESAMNVVLNLPVVQYDGETYLRTDLSDPTVDRIFTANPLNNQVLTYEFPNGTPLRTDLVPGQSLLSFEPLTTAVTITDYVQTPDWWHGEVIPKELFTLEDGSTPPVYRRVASSAYVLNTINPSDGAQIGDPGLLVGADEDGFVPPDISPGVPHPVYRHRLAFVLMDRYLKYHTFSVKFDPAVLSTTGGAAFTQSLIDLNELVLSAKPAHTYVMTTPATYLNDEVEVDEYDIDFTWKVGSSVYGPDKVIITDNEPTIGSYGWSIGDYFTYELFTELVGFPGVGTPVAPGNIPAAPRHRRLVHMYVAGTIGGIPLVENLDYTVDYDNGTVTRLTAWDSTTVNLTYRQVNVGNEGDAPAAGGDMPLLVGGVDPALITAAFSPTAKGWDGVTTPPSAPRDIGMVERALIVYPH